MVRHKGLLFGALYFPRDTITVNNNTPDARSLGTQKFASSQKCRLFWVKRPLDHFSSHILHWPSKDCEHKASRKGPVIANFHSGLVKKDLGHSNALFKVSRNDPCNIDSAFADAPCSFKYPIDHLFII